MAGAAGTPVARGTQRALPKTDSLLSDARFRSATPVPLRGPSSARCSGGYRLGPFSGLRAARLSGDGPVNGARARAVSRRACAALASRRWSLASGDVDNARRAPSRFNGHG